MVVDKPSGPTSHDVVDVVRSALGERRVGHTGTLDPFATGVLPVCVGKATRLARFLAAGEKAYQATVRLGFATTTDDATGEPIPGPGPVDVADDAVRAALAGLVGTYDQRAPAFSAKRIAGRRAYDLARRGMDSPPVVARVTVHALELLGRSGADLAIAVRCSPGTYVRAIARDLGDALGTGAHLGTLRRTAAAGFREADAAPLEAVRSRGAELLVPLDRLLTSMPPVTLTGEGADAVRHGRPIAARMTAAGFPAAGIERVRLLDHDGHLLALAVPRGFGPPPDGLSWEPTLHPDVVLVA